MTTNGRTEDGPDYVVPETVAAATRHLAERDGATKIVAGGQTLSLLLRQEFLEPDTLLDVSRIESLSGVDVAGNRIDIGATTTYADLQGHDVSSTIAMFEDACAVIGDRQVRQLGTVGGAVCHADPALDILAPLGALDGRVTLASEAETRTVPLTEFFVGHMHTARTDTELMTTIRCYRPETQHWGTAYEAHASVEAGWATVGVAAAIGVAGDTVTDARVALTAVADSSVRAPSVESELSGAIVSEEAIEDASQAVAGDIDPIDDRSGSAAYKTDLAATLTERAVWRAIERAGEHR